LEIVATFSNFSYFSSQSNFSFIVVSLYELIYNLVMTHYGFTKAFQDMKDALIE